MKKACQIKVLLWIEGEDEPRHDFAATCLETVRSLLSAPPKSDPTVKITIKKLEEYSSDDEET